MPDGAPKFHWRADPEYRYLVAALNGAGKSTLMAVLAAACAQGRKEFLVVLLDPKGDKAMRTLQPMPSHTLRRTGGGIQRFVVPPREVDREGITEEICRAAFYRGNVVLVIDELQMLADDRRYPVSLFQCYAQGRARKIPIIAASTEPVRIPVWARSQCRGFFCGEIGEGTQRDYMSDLMCQDRKRFKDRMHALQRYHFLYWEHDWGHAREPEDVWVRPPAPAGAAKGKRRG